jgi:hypothetical protein
MPICFADKNARAVVSCIIEKIGIATGNVLGPKWPKKWKAQCA